MIEIEFEIPTLPGTSPNRWVDTRELTPRQRITGLNKVRMLLCDLCVEEMHPRDVSAVLEVVDRHIVELERADRDDAEDLLRPRPPSKRKRKPRSRYVDPDDYVGLLARIPTAADRIHAAWEAGVVPDFAGRRGRENVLRHGETLAKGIMKRDEVRRLEQWVDAIDNAYNLIPKHPPSP